MLCVGAERAGLSEQTGRLVGEMLTIPLASPGASAVESLNAGVAGAIALYEFARRTDPPAREGQAVNRSRQAQVTRSRHG